MFENHKKVSFNIASEASFVKNSKNGQFGGFLKTWSLRSNSVSRKVTFIGQKLVENAKIQKLKWDIWSDFQAMWAELECVKWDFFMFSYHSVNTA